MFLKNDIFLSDFEPKNDKIGVIIFKCLKNRGVTRAQNAVTH